jgi:predicted nicotinamide N-methyase
LGGLRLGKTKLFEKVVCTDVLALEGIMNRNIEANNDLIDVVISKVLNWVDVKAVAAFVECYPVADVILAADVLYDIDIANSLFNVIRLLSNKCTVTFIAQKIRGKYLPEMSSITLLQYFKCEQVVAAAGVVVWRLQLVMNDV